MHNYYLLPSAYQNLLMDRNLESEEEHDVYHMDSYVPTVFPRKNRHPNEHIFFEPIPSQMFFPHQQDLDGTSYYSSHSPSNSKQTAFLCIHGAGQSAHVFGQLAKMMMQEATVVAYDLVCHGNTRINMEQTELSIAVFVEQALQFWNKITQIFPKVQQWVLVGHSLGGSIATYLSHAIQAKVIHGLVMIDTIEGAVKSNQLEMIKFLQERPSSFQSLESAIKWNYKANCVRRTESARYSIPSQFKLQQTGERYEWKVDLMKTTGHWQKWFQGVSSMFIESPVQTKLLLTTSTFRLDKTLKEALDNEKFSLELFEHSGHNIQEDQYEKVARTLIQWFL